MKLKALLVALLLSVVGSAGGQSITYTGSSIGGTPGGAAGGSLAGTYPNPSFAASPVFTGTASFESLTTSANSIFGDASGDTLTINAGTWTIGNNYVSTRAAGAVASGATVLQTFNTTASGDPGGGTTTVTPFRYYLNASGAFNFTTLKGLTSEVEFSGSGTATAIDVIGSLGATLSSTGNVTTVRGFRAQGPTFTSTGAITTAVGYEGGDQGHATLVTNAIAFRALNQTASVTLVVGFESAVTSGTGKWGCRASGTANNGFAGNTRIGSTVAPTVALDVTGAALISTTLGVTGVFTASGGATLAGTTTNITSTNLQRNGNAVGMSRTFTATYDPGTLAAGAQRTDDVTVTGITTAGGAVAANPGTEPAQYCVVASVRASAADTVKVTWQNTIDATTACDTASSTWTFTQAQ